MTIKENIEYEGAHKKATTARTHLLFQIHFEMLVQMTATKLNHRTVPLPVDFLVTYFVIFFSSVRSFGGLNNFFEGYFRLFHFDVFEFFLVCFTMLATILVSSNNFSSFYFFRLLCEIVHYFFLSSRFHFFSVHQFQTLIHLVWRLKIVFQL